MRTRVQRRCAVILRLIFLGKSDIIGSGIKINRNKEIKEISGGKILGKIIAVTNQKGGVGKTTTAVNTAAGIAMLGKKVLLVDTDPQGNATSGVGVDKRTVKYSSYSLMIDNVKAEDAVVHTQFSNLDIVPASMDLAAAEIELVEADHREAKLKTALAPIKAEYDFIFVDCPPSLGLITTNAFCAADTLLVPIQPEYYALEGLSQLMNTVRKVKRRYNQYLDIEGVLLTMYDGRLNLTQQVVAEVKRFFPRKVFSAVVPRGVRLSEAPSFGQPIMYFDKSSKGSAAYMDLSKEIIRNNE